VRLSRRFMPARQGFAWFWCLRFRSFLTGARTVPRVPSRRGVGRRRPTRTRLPQGGLGCVLASSISALIGVSAAKPSHHPLPRHAHAANTTKNAAVNDSVESAIRRIEATASRCCVRRRCSSITCTRQRRSALAPHGQLRRAALR
jgi:hypothetical protein